MRCEFCQKITIDNTNGETYRAMPMESEHPRPPIGLSHQPGFTALQASARGGCELCKIFSDAFLETWDMPPIVELEKRGVETVLMVRSDIWLPGLADTNDFGDTAPNLTLELRCTYVKNFPEADKPENPYVTFQIFTEDTDPAAKDHRIIGRPLCESSDNAIEFLRASLRFCMTRHKRCPPIQERKLPTRVLDVGFREEPRDPTLRESNGEMGLYATLSYCWGQNAQLKTTKETLEARKHGIPIATMPKTFVDAVQDSQEDWESESAQMASIYSNSVFTIAAAMASDSSQGFMTDRNPKYITALAEIDHVLPDQTKGKIYLRHDFDSWSRTVNNGVLARRAWTLQERLLASRVIHFGDMQAFWECDEMCQSESSTNPMATVASGLDPFDKRFREGIRKDILSTWNDDTKRVPRAGFNHGNFYLFDQSMARWYTCLSDYTLRSISRPSDKLPALSGLANAVSTKIGSSAAYIGGLWKEDFLRGLLWRPVLNGELKRYSSYIAPSWSWASVEGQICVDMDQLDRSKSQEEACIVQASTSLQDINIFGRVTSAVLILRTKVRYAWYIGDPRDTIPVTYNRTHITIDRRSPLHYRYALFEQSKTEENGFEPVALGWFDEDPGKDPKTTQFLVGLIKIGNWAPRISIREQTLADGRRRDLFVLRDPEAEYKVWALIVKWVDDFRAEDYDSKKVERIGIACMYSDAAFDGWPDTTVQIFKV